MTAAPIVLGAVTLRLHFSVTSPPEPQRGPRVALHGGKAHGFTPPASTRAEGRVRLAPAEQLPDGWEPLSGPLRLDAPQHPQAPPRHGSTGLAARCARPRRLGVLRAATSSSPWTTATSSTRAPACATGCRAGR